LEKRLSGVAELRYAMLYGKSQLKGVKEQMKNYNRISFLRLDSTE
jgi:hypothetical protein